MKNSILLRDKRRWPLDSSNEICRIDLRFFFPMSTTSSIKITRISILIRVYIHIFLNLKKTHTGQGLKYFVKIVEFDIVPRIRAMASKSIVAWYVLQYQLMDLMHLSYYRNTSAAVYFSVPLEYDVLLQCGRCFSCTIYLDRNDRTS